MKRFTTCFFVVAALFVLSPQPGSAQSNTPPNPTRPTQEPLIQELLSEVRQLRIAFQRMSLAAYRTQVMVERLRLQQEQIARLSQELGGIRNKLSEIRAQNARMLQVMGDVEDNVEKGLTAPAEVKAIKSALEEFKKTEQTLIEREIELSNELNTERANLGDLNRRLDALEREMVMTGAADEAKPAKKLQ